MSSIKGTNVLAPVVPFDTTDGYATHEALYGKGGYRTVAVYDGLALIPQLRREPGMVVWVTDHDKAYRLDDDLMTWVEQTYTPDLIDGGNA